MNDANEPVVVHTAASPAEAELLLSVLRGEGIDCFVRLANRAAGSGEGLGSWGPRDLLVRQSDAETARELLSQDDLSST